ncbi:MAG: excinuclease ABC subunit UvrC [Nanoarchaeota archaeon]|nr:excinuclease ABC subunit UvrC [Nanoarchaeota archaeon]
MQQKIKFLPTSPGCYLFKDSENRILYIGKAKNLRKRVSNYFRKKDHDAKTLALVREIRDVDTIVTSTESEALLLENNLIKKFTPQYNLDLKNSHRYAYLQIHDGDFPWIEVARKREKNGEYYGPFVSGKIRKLVLEVLQRNFKILIKKPSVKLKKILDKESYNGKIGQARKILSGKVDELISEIKKKMNEASGKTYYEYAISLRNQIIALKTLKQKQLAELNRLIDLNAINYKVIGDEVYLLVFSVRQGILEEKQSYSFLYYDNFFEDFLIQFYDSAPIPKEVIVPDKWVNGAFEKYLSEKRGGRVKIISPDKGEKFELLNLVAQNVMATFFTGGERIRELKKILNLKNLPRRIECFDISHLSGTNVVASMIAFSDGLPDKSSYRKFKISTDVNDDYTAMREVITRRYSGSLSKKMKNPDLIVVDGGLGQLNSAVHSLGKLNIEIPVIGLAKKFEEIYVEKKGELIIVDRKNKGLQLLQAMRDEAHRFAIGYQRLLRRKELSR